MKIYKNTVSEVLWEALIKLMRLEELKEFRLVGGTALSLLIGHRISVDIDLFTDSEYGTIDFDEVFNAINSVFNFVEIGQWGNNVIGNGGRKKDFWDIHELTQSFSIAAGGNPFTTLA